MIENLDVIGSRKCSIKKNLKLKLNAIVLPKFGLCAYEYVRHILGGCYNALYQNTYTM